MSFDEFYRYYRYIEPGGTEYKYIQASNRSTALYMLSYLIDEDGYGSEEETYYSLRAFEELEYFEVPENVKILYESEKNRLCVSGTSEGPTYVSGTNIGWTQNWTELKPNLYYALPFRVFVEAISKEAAFAKLFPIESTIKRKERLLEKRLKSRGIYVRPRKTQGTYAEIITFVERSFNTVDLKQILPDGVTVISDPVLDYDRWSNYVTGYLFRREGHQKRISEEQFHKAIKSGLLATYDLISKEIPNIDELCDYQAHNKIIFKVLNPYNNICKTSSLAAFLEKRGGKIDFKVYHGELVGVLSSTGEIIEIENGTMPYGDITDYEVYDKKKGFKYIRVIKSTYNRCDDLPF